VLAVADYFPNLFNFVQNCKSLDERLRGILANCCFGTEGTMACPSKHTVLLVDDEPGVRDTLARLLRHAGYDVSTAENGFDALLLLKRTFFDVIVSDLNMPKMSGFEFLSVVRRRFPSISVVASSGAYSSGTVPSGVIADAFYAKGFHRPETLLATVSELIQTSSARANDHNKESAPVWIPRNGKDSNGIPYIVLTCTECLRSFPLNVSLETNPEVVETPCLFCSNVVKYIIDFSLSVISPLRAAPSAATKSVA
jgi:CheY-like chemotaxis protein